MKKLKRYKNLVNNLRFSVEIEAAFPEKMDKNFFKEQYEKFFSGWTVTGDVSIEPEGMEFKPKDDNKLFNNKESFEQIKDVLTVIKSRGAKVNSSCGTHCHIDASKFTNEEILKIVKEVVARGEYICKDFNVNKNRLNDTCKLITKKDIRGLTANLIGKIRKGTLEPSDSKCPVVQDKYYILNILNLENYNTLEFRLFSGTLSAREIKNNLKFLFDFLISALERKGK